jgi:hypothetical protein
MVITKFTPLFIQRSKHYPQHPDLRIWGAAHSIPGLASLFAALHRNQDGAVSISADKDLEIPDYPEDYPSSADHWSLWARYGSRWSFRCVGAVSLDDLAEHIIEEIYSETADELRVCPPGTPEPARLP